LACIKASPVVARVGDWQITKKDVELRVLEQRFENQTAKIEGKTGLSQLLRDYATAEILKKYGRPVTNDILEQEAKRIDTQTLMPMKLKQIKDIFPAHSQYLNLYVLPVYVNRIVYYDFFLNTRQFHQAQFDKLQQFKEDMIQESKKNPKLKKSFSLKEYAKKNDLTFGESVVASDGIFPLNMPRRSRSELLNSSQDNVPERVKKAAFKAPEKTESQRLIDEVLSHLKPGDITQVLEWQNHYSVMLIKKIDSKSGEYTVETASAMKSDYTPWFNKEIQTVPMSCTERSVCPQVLREVRGY
jgi:hypothetical protein